MTLTEYYNRLAQFDWLWEYQDDITYTRKAREQENKLRQEGANAGKDYYDLFWQYSTAVKCGKPLPERP